jgi:hypothetical protein
MELSFRISNPARKKKKSHTQPYTLNSVSQVTCDCGNSGRRETGKSWRRQAEADREEDSGIKEMVKRRNQRSLDWHLGQAPWCPAGALSSKLLRGYPQLSDHCSAEFATSPLASPVPGSLVTGTVFPRGAQVPGE